MLATIVRFSLRYYGVVICLSIVLLCYGVYRFSEAGLDIFPEFSPKQVIIQTESPGLSAEQVEILVTQPIENSIGGLIGLKQLRSESIQGLSIVTAIFDESSDVYRNRQLISERLAGLSGILPDNVSTPVPVPLSSSSATVLTIGLTSVEKDLMQLRTLVDWTIVPRLLAVPGVADVNVFGGLVRQLQVQIDPKQMRRFNLSFEDIIKAAATAGEIQGGGFLENSNQRFTIQAQGLPVTPEQIAQIVVKHNEGNSIFIGDVATVVYAPEPPIGAAQINTHPGVVMMVIGQYGANTLSVSRDVEAALVEFDSIFEQQGIRFYSHLFRPADYIETSFNNLTGHLLLGALFVLLILYAFLFNIRTALISATAIPLSLVAAVIVLLEFGVNLNIMVLGGLAIALGEVVDDAIIDTENILRRLRENHLSENPRPYASVIYDASMEVRSSVVYASFIVALAFVPLLTLSGVAGRLFAPLGYSYILAILMSLLVALSLTPALCLLLLRRGDLKRSEPPLIAFIKPYYETALSWNIKHFKIVLSAGLFLVLAGIAFALNLGHKFLPELREGHFIVHTSSIPGTSLTESIRIGSRLTETFLGIDGIESVSQWAGRAERGADTYGSHYSEYEVRLHPMPGDQQGRVLAELRQTLGEFPGILFEANTFLTERIDETISGYTSPIVVNVYGNNLAQLDQIAGRIVSLMHKIPGATDIQMRSPPGTALLEVKLNLEQLAYWGLQPEQVLDVLQTAYAGRVVGKNIVQNRVIDIAVTLNPEHKQQPESLGLLPIKSQDGQLIALQQVADIQQTEGRYNILHQGAQRKQTITCNVEDRDTEAFIKELKKTVLQNVEFPADIYPEFTGAAIEQQHARHELIMHSLLATVGVLVFIYIAIGSFRHMLITLLNLPFALVGGLLAVIVTGATLSVGSVVGFVTLFGITVRNSIMLLSHYHYLVFVEQHPWNFKTALLGAEQRLPSILMTALVTSLAMFPIAFNSDNPGREIMGPMAAIIIGGLVSSTVLNLLLLPGFLLRFGKFERRFIEVKPFSPDAERSNSNETI